MVGGGDRECSKHNDRVHLRLHVHCVGATAAAATHPVHPVSPVFILQNGMTFAPIRFHSNSPVC